MDARGASGTRTGENSNVPGGLTAIPLQGPCLSVAHFPERAEMVAFWVTGRRSGPSSGAGMRASSPRVVKKSSEPPRTGQV